MMLNRSDRPVSLEAKRLTETTLDLDAVLATRWADPRAFPAAARLRPGQGPAAAPTGLPVLTARGDACSGPPPTRSLPGGP